MIISPSLLHERERWAAILRLAENRPVLPVREVIGAIGASPATLRRDLTRLAARGLIRRVHGGIEAVRSKEAPRSAAPVTRVEANKRAIARAAAGLCADGASIIINGGTTTLGMATFLRDRDLQVLTNSFALAQALVATTRCRVVVPGGEIHRDQNLILSPFDADAVQTYAASLMFTSAMSIGPQGLVEGDPMIARAEAKLMARSVAIVALADSTKFAARGNMIVAPLDRIRTLVTDCDATDEGLEPIRAAGVEVIVAAPESDV